MQFGREVSLMVAAMLVAMATTTPAETTQDLVDSHMRNLQQNRRIVQMLRDLLVQLDGDMETVQKRTCYINAGLSHGCDYKDVVGAIDEAKYWGSVNSPGKRRRRGAKLDQL